MGNSRCVAKLGVIYMANVQGAKRPVKGRNIQGAKHQRGEMSINPTIWLGLAYLSSSSDD